MLVKHPAAVEFEVRGRGQFPFDMLRYDSCWPKHESDSAEIERNVRRGTDEYTVRLMSVGLNSPTIGRWNSFGWKVV
jgi:hypothetical protein